MFSFGKEDDFNSTDILVPGELPQSRMASPLAKVIERPRAHTWNLRNSKQLTPWLISPFSRKSGISTARKRPYIKLGYIAIIMVHEMIPVQLGSIFGQESTFARRYLADGTKI